MSRFVLLLTCALAFGSGTIVSAQPRALIEETFPTVGEVRKPDRTLQKMETHPVVIAYSPDGRTLAVAGSDQVIRLWEARTGEQGTGELLRTLTGHTGRIWAFAFSTDGKTIVSASDDRTLKTWDVATGKLLRSSKGAMVGKSGAFLPGSEPRLAEIADTKVRFWRDEKGRSFTTVSSLSSKEISCMALTPDGKIIALAAGDTILLQNLEEAFAEPPTKFRISKRNVHRVKVGSPVTSLVASATHLAAGCADGSVQVWPLTNAEPSPAPLFKGHTGAVRALAFGTKSEQLASAGADKTVKVWDVVTGTLLCSQEGHADEVIAVTFNSNGQKMASADTSGVVNYWTVPLPPIPPDDLEKIIAALPAKPAATPKKPHRLLVFWRADSILHKSGVPAANHAIELLGQKTGAFESDFSRDYAALDPKVLANYDAIVLNSTAHLAIPESAKKALLDFVARGGGVIGIHAAIDTFKGWPEGSAIVGATFGGHPWGPSGSWAVKIEDPNHPLVRAFGGKDFRMHDEFYEMAEPFTRADRRVLLTLDVSDEKTANPGAEPLHRKDRDFAVSWIKRAGPARIFYCCFGHIGEPFQNPAVLQYYLDGIQYVLGDLVVDDTPPVTPKI